MDWLVVPEDRVERAWFTLTPKYASKELLGTWVFPRFIRHC